MVHGFSKKALNKLNVLGKTLKPHALWIGRILAAGGLLYLFLNFKEQFSRIDITHHLLSNWPALLGLTLTWACTGLFLALAWYNVLASLKIKLSLGEAISIYGISQVSKYIPGNIFQFISRHIRFTNPDQHSKSLLKSYLNEILILIGAACCFLPFIITSTLLNQNQSLYLVLLITGFCTLSLRFFLDASMTSAFCFSFIYHLTTGILFSILINILEGTVLSINYFFVGVYICSWIIGFLSFGAPAGIGVREVVLFEALKEHIASDYILTAVILIRLISILADLTFFGISFISKKVIIKG